MLSCLVSENLIQLLSIVSISSKGKVKAGEVIKQGAKQICSKAKLNRLSVYHDR